MLGLIVGASAKEQTRQISRLRQYIEAEQKPDNDYSFDGLGDLDRTISSVEIASSQLNLNEDKMMAALFWFYNGNKITDEPAFDALKDHDVDTCIAIWEKLIENGEITDRNASAFNNLGTFYISLNVENSDLVSINHPTKGFLSIYKKDKDRFKKGIALKLQFLESDFAHKLKALATDETYKFNQKELQLLFLNQLQTELEVSQSLSKINFIGTINQLTFLAKADYLKGFIQMPIENIERQINEAERKSKANKGKAGDYGNELYNATKDDFSLVKSILLNSDIKLTNIADKLAEALLDCSIAVFNHFHKTETEVGEIALDLNNKAKTIARSNRVIARITESSSVVQDYVNGKEERKVKDLCWFCQKNKAEAESKYQRTLYKETGRAFKKVYYNTTTCTINRCKPCQTIHSKGVLGGCLIALIPLFIIYYLFFTKPNWNIDGFMLTSFFGLFISGTVSWLSNKVLDVIKVRKYGIKMIDDDETHPNIKHLLDNEWGFDIPN
jgi:hypothetical protein